MPDIEIKLAQKEDLSEVYNVIKTSWLATYPNQEISINQVENFLASNENRFLEGTGNLITKGQLWIALDMDKIIGFSSARIKDGKGQIMQIYLYPEYIGKGVGRLLMQIALDFMKSCEEIIVECASYNERAINFYRKFGFEKEEEIEGFNIGENISIPQVRLTKKQILK